MSEQDFYITQNSLFDIYIIDDKEENFKKLYDTLYEIQIETYEMFRHSSFRDNLYENIAKIILISFILNTDFFFRMFPDDTTDDTTDYYTNILHFIHSKIFNIILDALLSNDKGKLLYALFRFHDLNDTFFDIIIDIHLDNLYNFPHNNVITNEILIPQDFENFTNIKRFVIFFKERITQIIQAQAQAQAQAEAELQAQAEAELQAQAQAEAELQAQAQAEAAAQASAQAPATPDPYGTLKRPPNIEPENQKKKKNYRR
jgi:hypothetical protein